MTKEGVREEINEILELADIDIDKAYIEQRLNSWRRFMITSPLAIILAAASSRRAFQSRLEKEAQGIYEFVESKDVPHEEATAMLIARIKKGVERERAKAKE